MADLTTFGGLLRWVRTQRGIPQEAFAQQVGVSVETLKAWELDKAVPSASEIAAIARVLAVKETDRPRLEQFLQDAAREGVLKAMEKQGVHLPSAGILLTDT